MWKNELLTREVKTFPQDTMKKHKPLYTEDRIFPQTTHVHDFSQDFKACWSFPPGKSKVTGIPGKESWGFFCFKWTYSFWNACTINWLDEQATVFFPEPPEKISNSTSYISKIPGQDLSPWSSTCTFMTCIFSSLKKMIEMYLISSELCSLRRKHPVANLDWK